MHWQEPHVLNQPVLDLVGRHSPNPGPVDDAGDELVVNHPITVHNAPGDGAEKLRVLGEPLGITRSHLFLAVPRDLTARKASNDDTIRIEREKRLDVSGVVGLHLALDDGLG